MKKLLAVMLALLMIATLAACSKEQQNGDDLDDYVREEKVITFETNEKGETFHFEAIDTETVAITAYEGSDAAHLLEIPSTLNGKTVVAIANAAFKDCSKINAISFPETVTTIGNYAFAGCVLLEYIDIPETVTSIGIGAFTGCTNLSSVIFEGTPKIASIERFAFQDCSALTSIEIPASVKTVGDAAFMNCSALTTVVLKEGVETVGDVAFRGCTALASLTLPASLTTIGQYVFSDCDALFINNVTVPEGSAAHTYLVEEAKLPEQID